MAHAQRKDEFKMSEKLKKPQLKQVRLSKGKGGMSVTVSHSSGAEGEEVWEEAVSDDERVVRRRVNRGGQYRGGRFDREKIGVGDTGGGG